MWKNSGRFPGIWVLPVEWLSNQAAAEEMLLAMSPAFESGKPRVTYKDSNGEPQKRQFFRVVKMR